VGVPLLITAGKLAEIVDALEGRIDLKLNFDPTDPTTSTYSQSTTASTVATYTYPDNVSVIPISGTLVHKSSGLQAMSGLTSYQSIAQKFQSALSDPDTDTIVMDINSPGGEVAGVFDLSEYIYNSRGTKPIIAFANDLCCSAAFALASSAHRVYVTRTANAGSIGVILVHEDRSAANANSGVKYTTITAGTHKSDYSPNSPLTDSAMARAQAQVNTIYDLFVSTVARNLSIDESVVRSTEALTYMGEDSVTHKLAHKVVITSDFLASLNKGEPTMSNLPNVQTTPPTPEAASTQAQVDHNQRILQATTAAIQTERDRCFEILEACQLGDCLALAPDLIADGSSPDTARKLILSTRHVQSNATTVYNNIPDVAKPDANVLINDAQSRAAAHKNR
jgi:signal peptide peptidase SppA